MGPLMFLLYIADLEVKNGGGDDESNDSKVKKVLQFVDDTKVIAGIKNEDDLIKFQEELEPIYQWSDINNMNWNNSKFK